MKLPDKNKYGQFTWHQQSSEIISRHPHQQVKIDERRRLGEPYAHAGSWGISHLIALISHYVCTHIYLLMTKLVRHLWYKSVFKRD